MEFPTCGSRGYQGPQRAPTRSPPGFSIPTSAAPFSWYPQMPAPNEVQIGLVTDSHFWFGSNQGFGAGGRQLQPQSQLLLDLLVTDLQAQNLDLILHLGDITCGGGGYGMPDPLVTTAIQKVKAGLESIGCPVGMVPGNHDCRLGHSFNETNELLGLAPESGSSYTFPEAKLHFELIHTQSHTSEERAEDMREGLAPVHGRVAPAELARLQNSLQDASGLNVLVGSHQLLVPMSSWREPVEPRMRVAQQPGSGQSISPAWPGSGHFPRAHPRL